MQTITLDIGGTTIKSALIDDFEVKSKTKLPTRAKEGFEKIMESISASIDFHIPFLKEGEYRIGISSAGDIDPLRGVVTYATDSLPNFTGLELKKIIESKYNVSVSVLNDALCATLAEFEMNEELRGKDIVMLTLGTGVGGGVVVGSKLVLGEHFKAGRLGHIKLHNGGRKCPCSKLGCAEAYVSATGFLRTAREFGVDKSDSNEVFAHDDKEVVDKIIDVFVGDLASLIDTLENVFDPYAIVLGGGLVMTSEFWYEKLLQICKGKTRIVKAKLKNDAGIFGAYCMANNPKKYFG